MSATPAIRPVPGDLVRFQGQGDGYVVSVDWPARTATYTDGVSQDGILPLRDLRPGEGDPYARMTWDALPVGYWQGERVGIVCPLCATTDPATWSTSEPVYRPATTPGEFCAALGDFNHPDNHDLDTLPARILQDAAVAVWGDVRESYPELTLREAIDHTRDTLRLPEDTPVMGAYPLNDDGTPLAAAYRLILAATPREISNALTPADSDADDTPAPVILPDLDGADTALHITPNHDGTVTVRAYVGTPADETWTEVRVTDRALIGAVNPDLSL